jgi:hypothetical protein
MPTASPRLPCKSLPLIPCKPLLRLRRFRELSLGENFSFREGSSPRALISGRGLSKTCATLSGHYPRFPFTPPCADMLPDPRGQNTPSAGRGLPSTLAVNPGSRDHSTGPAPTQLLHMVAGTMLPTRAHTLVSGGRDPHWSLGRQLYRDTRLLRQRRPLPSLPGSTALSCAPSGSLPRLSATRATPSRAPIWRAGRYHSHESVTPAE